MSWGIILSDIVFLLMIAGGIWSIYASISSAKPLHVKANGSIRLANVAQWYGYFFGAILILCSIAGLCGAYR
ncbi:hypothetical protein [Lactobacillus sp. PSON]|uniref:hypothetical protein n=1 Tax=Lactobacillus sp. PSON TaxID=3455454 RepID=UPI004041A33F